MPAPMGKRVLPRRSAQRVIRTSMKKYKQIYGDLTLTLTPTQKFITVEAVSFIVSSLWGQRFLPFPLAPTFQDKNGYRWVQGWHGLRSRSNT